MTKNAKLSNIDFKKIVEAYEEDFPVIQVLDPKGKVVDKKAMESISDEELVKLMEAMYWARTMDERTIILNRQGSLVNYATAGGQEASQYGPLLALKEDDFFTPTYRDINPSIFFGWPMEQAFMWYLGHVDANKIDKDLPMYAPNVIVGGTPIQGAGNAIGMRLKEEDRIVLTYTGDSATSQGDFYEGLNFAGVYKGNMVVVIQNNGYGISVPVSQQTAAKALAQKGSGAGVPAIRVDGMDPVAMYLATKKAREYAVENGPVLIEALTYRFGPHTMSDDPKRYREDSEVEEWKKKDPLTRLGHYLREKELWSDEQEKEIYDKVQEDVKEALAKVANFEDQKVSEFLNNMFDTDHQPQNIKEQLAIWEEKERK